jgi:hypothetical protein
MKQRIHLVKLGLGLVLFFLISAAVHACTIFVLTDTNRVLFCNNELSKPPNAGAWVMGNERSTKCS